jgi:hypothetical protein
MGVINRAADVYRFQSSWELVRDCIEGESAIKSKGEAYLPRASGQSDNDYRRYITKTRFFNATGRAADGLHGNVFAKPPLYIGKASDRFAKSLENVDRMGTNIEQFASDLIWDALQTNWGGILVDYAKNEGNLSKLEAENQGLKSYIKWYKAEDVINWDYQVINGSLQLALVVLHEPYNTPSASDRFIQDTHNRYRVLYLDREDGGVYKQDIYDDKISLDFPAEAGIAPKINGINLKSLPFFPCPGRVPEKSILYDLAILNIGHYQDMADYQNGKHYTSIPTPIAIGLSPAVDENGNPKPMYVGGTKFQFFPNENMVSGADVKYLEFTGAGMKALAEGISAIEERMAILGAHIIMGEKRAAETAEALRIHRAGENGVLSAFTRNVSDQLTKSIRLKGIWDGESPEQMEGWSINLNVDYDIRNEDSQTLQTLITGRVSGEIPRMSLFMGLKNLQLIPEDWDYDTFVIENANDSIKSLPDVHDQPLEEEQD